MSKPDTNLLKSLEDFKRSVEITRDVRFQAALRLSSRHRNSSYLVSLLSLFVISISLLPNVYSLSQSGSQILLACSIILSVFVIFSSLIDGSQNFYHQGELLHECARGVATVYHELKNITENQEEEEFVAKLTCLQERYREALDKCPINHSNVDYLAGMLRKPHLFPNNFAGGWFFYPHYALIYIRYIISMLAWLFLPISAVAIVGLLTYFVVVNSKMIGL